MGGSASKSKKQNKITDVDRGVLSLKTQRRKIQEARARVERQIEREVVVARTLVAQGNRGRALLALRKKKLQEGQLARLDDYLLKVEGVLVDIETAEATGRVVGALRAGAAALREAQRATPLEEVEALVAQTAEAQAYQRELTAVLAASLDADEDARAARELEDMERQLIEERVLDLPSVPTGEAALVGSSEQREASAASLGPSPAREGASATVADLPSVPSGPMRHAQPAPAEEAEDPVRVPVLA